jgi:hypothetical protein
MEALRENGQMRALLAGVCIGLSVGVAATLAYERYLGRPSTFAVCVLEHLGASASNFAARLVEMACRQQFPE